MVAMNGNHGTLLEIGAKARYFPKTPQNACKVVNILFHRSQEDGRVIRIEGGPHHGTPTTDFVEDPLPCSHV